jgi:hypothetical protein
MATIQSITTKLIPGASRHNGVKGGKALKRAAGEGGRGGRHPSTPPRGKTMLQQLNGTTSKHSLNGHLPINGKEHGSKSGVPTAHPETGSTRAPSLGGLALEAVKRPNRKPAAKGKRKLRKIVQCGGRPYALPSLFDCGTEKTAKYLEMYCQTAIRAAWAASDHGRVKAARDDIARWHLTPADIATLARALADYNRRAWPARETAKNLDWLSVGSGCCERIGTEYDAHIGAWSALMAAISIIVEVPLERDEDAEALFETLTYTGWRHVPHHQQRRVARRMARFVTDRIMGLPFVPTPGLGAVR